ncbi:MAG: VOC family protein [Rhodospirillales bacterium]
MKPRISMVTLGVSDLARAVEFYQTGVGLPKMESPPEVAFFNLDGSWLGLFDRKSLADEAMISPEGSGYSGFNIAHNVASEAEVDEVMDQASAAGAQHNQTCREDFVGWLFWIFQRSRWSLMGSRAQSSFLGWA